MALYVFFLQFTSSFAHLAGCRLHMARCLVKELAVVSCSLGWLPEASYGEHLLRSYRKQEEVQAVFNRKSL